ncbi:hypothetical protein [Pararhodobacter sp. SW119]|uniref:hypothetical protein n=1 Tax=Pararhodobacter sp. SW119 TaxID=2780075 RepID=UPI001AE0DC25|nr:hypothetical protein [Pararhodobacter sp. SW119]
MSLILGHMIHERIGFFRGFLDGKKRISDLLFDREEVGGEQTYRLTVAAEKGFRALGLI